MHEELLDLLRLVSRELQRLALWPEHFRQRERGRNDADVPSLRLADDRLARAELVRLLFQDAEEAVRGPSSGRSPAAHDSCKRSTLGSSSSDGNTLSSSTSIRTRSRVRRRPTLLERLLEPVQDQIEAELKLAQGFPPGRGRVLLGVLGDTRVAARPQPRN